MAKGFKSRGGLILLFAVALSLMLGGLSEASAVVYQAGSRTFYGWSTGNYASKTKIASGDVNGDHRGDVIQLYYSTTTTSKVYVFRSGGAAMTKYYQRSFTMEFSKTQIAAGDYNGDGYDDVYLLHDRGSSTCGVYVMTSNGTSLGAPVEVYRTTTGGMAFSRARLTATDVNNDGIDEAVVFYESSAGKAKVYVIGKSLGQIQGRVEDARTGAAVSGVGVVLRNGSGAQIAYAETDEDGSYTLSAPVGSGYHADFVTTDYMPATYWGISASSGGLTSLETAKLVPAGATGAGVASGIISNAFDGTGVPGLTLYLHAGMNNTTGPRSVYSADTGSDGSYSFAALPGGVYTAEITGADFLTTYFTVVSVGGMTIGNQNAAITPDLVNSTDIRIVLTWGATPSDLDSHLTGPISGSASRFHIYYSDKRYPYSGSPVIALLDVDERSSYGPETITLSRTSGGVYRYSVYNFSSGYSSSPSTALADSGAQVRLYQGSSLIRTFNVPNAPGTLWKVFEMSGTTITPFNTMSYTTSSSMVP